MSTAHNIIIGAILQPGVTLTWIISGSEDDELPTGVILPSRKPLPTLCAHAVPVVDELVPCLPLPN